MKLFQPYNFSLIEVPVPRQGRVGIFCLFQSYLVFKYAIIVLQIVLRYNNPYVDIKQYKSLL